jgi:hypothetical protein
LLRALRWGLDPVLVGNGLIPLQDLARKAIKGCRRHRTDVRSPHLRALHHAVYAFEQGLSVLHRQGSRRPLADSSACLNRRVGL